MIWLTGNEELRKASELAESLGFSLVAESEEAYIYAADNYDSGLLSIALSLNKSTLEFNLFSYSKGVAEPISPDNLPHRVKEFRNLLHQLGSTDGVRSMNSFQ